MKILVASHTYIVPLNQQKLKILASLNPEIQVTIVVPRYWKPGGVQSQAIETKFYQEGSFKVVPISNFSQTHQGLLTFGADLIKLLRDFKPQIIQVEQGSKSLAYAQSIALNKLLKIQAKNIFFTWWNLPYQLKWPISTLEAYNLKHTDGIVVGNQDGAAILREHGYSGPIKIMPQLGVDESLFRPTGHDTHLSQQLNIQPTDFIVGFVGRFVEEKGLLTLAKALSGIQERPWKWLLVGRGELRPRLTEAARAWGIQDQLIWVDSVPHDRVYRYLNLMNVLVLPSETSNQFQTLSVRGWQEQFGHVLIEAMACQVPVIGSNCGEIPNVIQDAGLVFPEGDVAALRDCLRRLMGVPELAAELGKRGYRRVMENYTNRILAEQLLEFYQELF